MSYYKYVKRDEKSRVDWGAITSNLVDTLKEQEADREKQREAIDASSRATGDVLSDAPQGANKSAGEWILNASSDASQYLMSQNRLLKSGLLDPRDFTVNRQNVENSFKSLQTMAESAHKESQLTQDRINEGKAMNFEGVVGQRLDDFQNFEKTQVYFNPTNGVASIGIKDKDGNLPDDPSQFSTIEGAIAQMQSRYDKFDYTSPLVKWSESIGSDVRVVRKKGVLTIDDPSVQKNVNSSLDDAIAALTVNDLRVLSIAEDLGLVAPDDYNLGATETKWGAGLTDVETTRLSELESIDSRSNSQQDQLDKLISKQKKSSRQVGVSTTNDGTVIPKANDALKEAVKERLKEEGMALLDYKETAMPEDRAAQAFNRVRSSGAKDDAAVLDAVGLLYSGNQNDIDSAVKSLAGLNPNIQSIQRTNRGVTVIYKDGKTSDLPFYKTDGDGNVIATPELLIDGRNWTTGAAGLITGIAEKNYNKIAEESSWNPMYDELTIAKVYEPYDESETTFGFSYGTTAKDPLKAVQDIKAGVTAELFASDDEDTVAKSVSEVVSKLGFNVEGVGFRVTSPFTDAITVTNPVTGESVEIETSDSEKAKNNLLSFINSQVATAEDIMRVNLQSGGAGTVNYPNL